MVFGLVEEVFMFGLNYKNSNQNYTNPDPSTSLVVKNKKDEITLNSKYAYNLSNIFGLDLSQIKQSSNDALRTYNENQVSLQYMWLCQKQVFVWLYCHLLQ